MSQSSSSTPSQSQSYFSNIVKRIKQRAATFIKSLHCQVAASDREQDVTQQLTGATAQLEDLYTRIDKVYIIRTFSILCVIYKNFI